MKIIVFCFVLLSLVTIYGTVLCEETVVESTKNSTTTDGNSTTSSTGKDSPALISLYPSQGVQRFSLPGTSPQPGFASRRPSPPAAPLYHQQRSPHYSHPHHNPHQYYHHEHSHHSHFNHPHHYHHQHNPSQLYYRSQPQSILPVLVDRAQLGDLVSGFGQAFTSFLSQRAAAPRSAPVRLLNGENILATASQLIPAAANRLLGGLQQLQQPSNSFNLLQSPLFSQTKLPLLKSNKTSTPSDDSQIPSASTADQTVVQSSGAAAPPSPAVPNYDEEEGRRLREDIITKVGHLQNILTTYLEVSKERRDILTKRILEQTNYRLEQAKVRADQLLSEPQNAQMVLRALQALNQGVGGISTFLQSLFERINMSNNMKMNEASMTSTEAPKEASSDGTTSTIKPE